MATATEGNPFLERVRGRSDEPFMRRFMEEARAEQERKREAERRVLEDIQRHGEQLQQAAAAIENAKAPDDPEAAQSACGATIVRIKDDLHILWEDYQRRGPRMTPLEVQRLGYTLYDAPHAILDGASRAIEIARECLAGPPSTTDLAFDRAAIGQLGVLTFDRMRQTSFEPVGLDTFERREPDGTVHTISNVLALTSAERTELVTVVLILRSISV